MGRRENSLIAVPAAAGGTIIIDSNDQTPKQSNLPRGDIEIGSIGRALSK